MTECIKARQWLYRALRTAVQAAADSCKAVWSA